MAENSPITAARFSITVDGYEIASFSELQGVRTEIKTVEFIESGEKGLVQMNIPSNPVLATIILKRAQTQDPQMWTWHEAARFGEMGAARKSCSLVMFDVDGRGQLHRDGVMRLATAGDEIWPQTDPRVRENPAYLSVLLLTRTVTQLGSLPEVDSRVIENLFASDLAFLQDLYRRINQDGG